MNRNHFSVIGVVVLCIGLQFNHVESFTLSEPVVKVMAHQAGNDSVGLFPSGTGPTKTITPPPWLRYALMAVGTVFLLHAVAMQKP